jgi:hypothetical protein
MKQKLPSNRRSVRLQKQIEELREIAFKAQAGRHSSDSIYLEMERDSVVRARILLDASMAEELLALAIMHQILADCKGFRELKYFGRTKKYRVFFADILGRVPARHKMTVLKKFIQIPKAVRETVDRMLALRDLFAHVCTLDYGRQRELMYNGHSVLTRHASARF